MYMLRICESDGVPRVGMQSHGK